MGSESGKNAIEALGLVDRLSPHLGLTTDGAIMVSRRDKGLGVNPRISASLPSLDLEGLRVRSSHLDGLPVWSSSSSYRDGLLLLN